MADSPDTINKKLFANLLYEQARTSQFMLLGDSQHGDQNITRLATNPLALQSLARAGVKTLMLEHMTYEQPAFDALANGTISKRQFVSLLDSSIALFGNRDAPPEEQRKNAILKRNMINDVADTILSAKTNGIKVVAIDGMEGDYNRLYDLEHHKRTYQKAIDMARADPNLMITKGFYKNLTEQVADDMKQDGSAATLSYKPKKRAQRSDLENMDPFSQRMEMDHLTLAQRIFETAQGQPAAILYGGWHMAKVNDLDETLERLHTEQADPKNPRRATSVINIYDSPNGNGIKDIKGFCQDFDCAASPNHLNYYYRTSRMDTGNIGLKTEPASPNAVP
ncbi:MAG: hypothetical protein WC043_00970 [Pseudobdellovibrionaceae bacterium]